jgi:urea transporter
MTDVGARCPACAPARKLPQFEVGPLYILRGAAAGLLAGAVLGALWALILPGAFGFFSVFIGIGLGYGVAEPISLATNKKSGPVLAVIAGIGVLIAYAVRNVVNGDALFVTNDLYGYIVLVVGAIVAVNRLRI